MNQTALVCCSGECSFDPSRPITRIIPFLVIASKPSQTINVLIPPAPLALSLALGIVFVAPLGKPTPVSSPVTGFTLGRLPTPAHGEVSIRHHLLRLAINAAGDIVVLAANCVGRACRYAGQQEKENRHCYDAACFFHIWISLSSPISPTGFIPHEEGSHFAGGRATAKLRVINGMIRSVDRPGNARARLHSYRFDRTNTV